jgi:hypothetical protein
MLDRILISALALFSVILLTGQCSALDQNLYDTILTPLSKYCAKQDSDECLIFCDRLQKNGIIKKLPSDLQEYKLTCEYALQKHESKQLIGARACNESACIVKINRAAPSSYSGNGFTVSFVNNSSATSGETLIVTTIHAPGGGKTVIAQNCNLLDSSCGGWKHQSGPLRDAQVTFFDKYAILRFNK